MQAQEQLTVRLLGPVEVRAADGRDLTPPGKKLRALLACLALSSGKAWEREKLSALLWSDRDEEQARASLRQALAELRRLLGEPSPLKADRETIGFDPTVAAVDVVEFERLAAAGKMEQAASLYVGDLMDGQIPSDAGFATWLAIERTRLHNLAIDVLTKLANARGGEDAIPTVQRMLEIDPLREESHRMLMRLYAADGQRAQALRQYQICREALQRELDAAPESETELLLKQIQSSDNGTAVSLPRATGLRSESISGDVTEPGRPAPPTKAAAARRRLHPWHLTLAGVALLLAGAAMFHLYTPTEPQDGFPSIIVLPFKNISGDPALSAYAGSITDDVITMASHFPDFRVVSRNANAGDKDPIDFGRDLNADYVLLGSVQRKGANLRVNAQLVDTHTNRHIWADGYEGSGSASLQDEAVGKIILCLSGEQGAIKKNEYERIKGKADADLTEYEYYLKGHEIFSRFESIEEHDRAGAIWLEGLKKYPHSSLLRAKLAWYHFMRPWEYDTDKPAADERKAGEYARAALAAQNASPMVRWLGHWLMAYVHWHEGDFIHAVQNAETAVAINPHDANTMSFLARVQIAAGNPERAIEWIEATRFDPNLQRNTRILAWAYYLTGEYEKSIEAAKQHVKLSREFPAEVYLFIAADNVRLGRLPEARAALATLLKEKPTWSLATERAWELDWPYKDKAVLGRWLADLAAAGYPELPFGDTVKGYERLTTEELKHLTFGHTVRGRDLDTGSAYVDVIASDGSVRTTGDYGTDTGVVSYLNDGLICYRWTDWGSDCGSIFRKQSESPEKQHEFLYIILCCRYQISVH